MVETARMRLRPLPHVGKDVAASTSGAKQLSATPALEILSKRVAHLLPGGSLTRAPVLDEFWLSTV
jgi:hypothetical protein